MADLNTPLDLPEALFTNLAELGLKARVNTRLPVDGLAERADVSISRAGVTQRFDVLCGRRLRMADVAAVARRDLPQFVLTDYVPEATGAAFRRAGIGYLDQAGNAWISFGAVLVDIRGRRRVGPPEESPAPRGNLFSPGSAQVVLALLAWPVLWRATRRDVAHAAGVSVGKAHDALTLLERSGFGPDTRERPAEELLNLWAAAYPTGLARSLFLGSFHGSVENVRPVDSEDRLYVSGELAVDYAVKPATLDVYVTELEPRLAVVNRWRADGPLNITVRRCFWRDPGDARTSDEGRREAPWPLVYADLLASSDPRVRAVAGDWKERRAGSLERP
ncbi:type IV toxin-antitoxin system AbiEi family antitoxin [Promicromonospora sukumoe]|uniref:type IV toxin-antitoxin system AbiEi family antitoxin n=1 Tax=Promicromonospora sukumoe TaxID=88382 RepID=UPI0037C69C98